MGRYENNSLHGAGFLFVATETELLKMLPIITYESYQSDTLP